MPYHINILVSWLGTYQNLSDFDYRLIKCNMNDAKKNYIHLNLDHVDDN